MTELRLQTAGIAKADASRRLTGHTTDQSSADAWARPVSADWSDRSAWSLSKPPGASNDATIATAGQYTVTIDSAQSARSLTMDDSSATVVDNARLSIGTALSVAAGSFVLASGGDVVGGTISVGSGGTFNFDGGTLTGATFTGGIDLAASNSSVTLKGGTSLTGADVSDTGILSLTGSFCSVTVQGMLSGASVINDTGAYDDLTLYGSRTLASGTLNIGSDYYSSLDIASTNAEGVTLTLGSDYTVDVVKFYGYVTLDNASDALVNQGTIDASTAGPFELGDGIGSIFNQGTIVVDNGSQTTIDGSMFSNSGTVMLSGSNSLLYLAHWTNTGVIDDSSGGLLVLGGVFSSAQLDTITGDGIINIVGLLTNDGTLSVGAGSEFGSIAVSGGIAGGTISDTGDSLVSLGGTLTDVTYEGVLTVGAGLRGAGSAALTLSNSTITGADGVGPGTLSLTGVSSTVLVRGSLTGADVINDTGAGASMTFYDTRTLDNGVLNIGSGSHTYLEVADDTGHGATLTLGSRYLVNDVAAGALIYLQDADDALINEGTIDASSTGAFAIGVGVGTIVNQGSIVVSNGATMTIEAARVVNYGLITVAGGSTLTVDCAFDSKTSVLSAGTFEVGSGALLQIDSGPLTATCRGDIILNGEGSDVQSLDANSGQEVSLDTSLARIAPGGTLSLLGGRAFNATTDQGRFADGGVLYLGSGVFDAQSLNVTRSGILEGYGTVQADVADVGLISATGGTLAFFGRILGHGVMEAAAAATIELESAAVLSPTIIGAGTLELGGNAKYKLDSQVVRVANVTIVAGSDLSGSGKILGAVNDDGSVVALAGDTLVVVGKVGGTGGFEAGKGALLDFRGGGDLTQSIAGSGLLKLQGDAGYALAGQDLLIRTLVVAPPSTLSGFGTIAGRLYDRGSVNASGGTLELSDSVVGHGTLAADTNATLYMSGDSIFSGTLSGDGTIMCDGALTLTAGAVLSVATVIDSGDVRLGSNTEVTNVVGSTFVLSGDAARIAQLTGAPSARFMNAGSLVSEQDTGSVSVDVINDGNISVGSGTLAFLGAVTNMGSIAAVGGLLSFATMVSGVGTLAIFCDGEILLRGGASADQTVNFMAGNGLMDLDRPHDFSGSIVGFRAEDHIDLLATAHTGFSYVGGLLTIFDGAAPEASIHFGGNYSADKFSLTSDGHGGTLIGYNA